MKAGVRLIWGSGFGCSLVDSVTPVRIAVEALCLGGTLRDVTLRL